MQWPMLCNLFITSKCYNILLKLLSPVQFSYSAPGKILNLKVPNILDLSKWISQILFSLSFMDFLHWRVNIAKKKSLLKKNYL